MLLGAPIKNIMLKDIDNKKILSDLTLNNYFLSANMKDIKEECKILKGDFYLDSFNYFPITSNYETFYDLFKRQDDNSLENFYNADFYKNLINKEKDFKIIKNNFVLGSSPADNYYSNLIHFLPRIFFTNESKINILIHRNLSNKFRNLIKSICEMREIEITFNFIDDEFYKFKNSLIPQFFNIEKSVKILQYFFEKILLNVKAPKFSKKIYIRREDANYRKILNESDLITKLIKNGFEIINPQHFEVLVQMKIFANAELIISPHGSNLSNIIFCKKRTKVIEISPNFKNQYEMNISNRYKDLSVYTNLEFSKLIADTVNVSEHSVLSKKYINNKILNESDYYKNLILKVSDMDELINSQQIDN